jgi:hypothetical protein
MLQRMKALMRLSLVALAFGSPTSAKSADDTVAMTWADGWFAFPKGFAGLPTRTTVKTLREAEALGEETKKPWPTVVYIAWLQGTRRFNEDCNAGVGGCRLLCRRRRAA